MYTIESNVDELTGILAALVQGNVADATARAVRALAEAREQEDEWLKHLEEQERTWQRCTTVRQLANSERWATISAAAEEQEDVPF